MKRILLITFLSVFIFKVYGQDNIGTPYSVYGIGLQTENDAYENRVSVILDICNCDNLIHSLYFYI